MADRGELEKLLIYAYTDPKYLGSSVAKYKTFINPEEYKQVYDVEYKEEQGEGTTGSRMVFQKIKPQQFSLKFYFDGTGISGKMDSVQENIKEFFTVVGYDGNIHRPKYLKIIWGTLEFNCILLKAEVTYKMFYPDGKPIRATIDATFAENIDDTTRVAEANDSSPDLTHERIVKEGDTLPSMCYNIYNDHTYYPEVARINKLNDFRNLEVGQKIIFPPLDKEE